MKTKTLISLFASTAALTGCSASSRHWEGIPPNHPANASASIEPYSPQENLLEPSPPPPAQSDDAKPASTDPMPAMEHQHHQHGGGGR